MSAAEGGQAFADVLSDPPNGGATNKHLGPVRYAPVSISFGSALADRLLDWITRALAGEQPERDGAIVFLDYRANEVYRLEFTGARISDIELPRFDAEAKETTEWTVVFQPTTTSASYRSAGRQHQAATARGKEKKWLAASFRLNISGLESATAHVHAVEPIIVHQEEGAPVRVGNLLITVNNAALPAFVAWHEEFVIKGNNTDDKERSGTLVQLAPNLKDDLFTIDLQHIGIVRITPTRAESTSRAVVSRSTIELYLEEVGLTDMSLPAPVPPAPSPAPPPPAPEAIGAPAPEMRAPAVVAERLLRTTNMPRLSELEPRARLEGTDAGERWAATTASLSELESLVNPGHRDWTELRLAGDHSLVDFLRSTGVLDGTGGPVDLSRDDFVDGLVAGAERVFREAQPHLGGAGGIPEPTPNDNVAGSSGRTKVKVTFDEVGKLVVIETLEGNKLTLTEDADDDLAARPARQPRQVRRRRHHNPERHEPDPQGVGHSGGLGCHGQPQGAGAAEGRRSNRRPQCRRADDHQRLDRPHQLTGGRDARSRESDRPHPEPGQPRAGPALRPRAHADRRIRDANRPHRQPPRRGPRRPLRRRHDRDGLAHGVGRGQAHGAVTDVTADGGFVITPGFPIVLIGG